MIRIAASIVLSALFSSATIRGEGNSTGQHTTSIVGLFRDFRDYQLLGGHPDFMRFGGVGEKGCVYEELVNGKPVLVPDKCLHCKCVRVCVKGCVNIRV